MDLHEHVTVAVDGDWGDWAEWSSCSEPCGEGTQEHYRRCDNPRPEHGGRPCRGDELQRKPCTLGDCEGKAWLRFILVY